MPQRLDKCARTLSAKIIVQTGTMQNTLQVFGPQLVQITGKEQSQIDVETILTMLYQVQPEADYYKCLLARINTLLFQHSLHFYLLLLYYFQLPHHY